MKKFERATSRPVLRKICDKNEVRKDERHGSQPQKPPLRDILDDLTAKAVKRPTSRSVLRKLYDENEVQKDLRFFTVLA